MKKHFYLISVLLLLIKLVNAQEPCGSMLYLEKQLLDHPALISKKLAFEERMLAISSRDHSHAAYKTDAIIRIPIVVHIVYNSTLQNISDAQVYSQIDALNRDFAGMNPDSLPSSHPFYGIVGKAGIEFCLATMDENLNPTTGITRDYTSQALFSLELNTSENVKFSRLGGVDAWDPGKYLNIWVCNLAGPVLGYARFPYSIGDDPFADGLVIGYTSFGGIGTSTRPNARTAVHEIGHWLGLRHIWGDAVCGDDRIADTPPAEDKNFFCPTFPFRANNSCGSDANGEMYMNYMDYADDNCVNSFSKGQIDLMRTVLNEERYELTRSDRCNVSSVGIASLGTTQKYWQMGSNINDGHYHIDLSEELMDSEVQVHVCDVLGHSVYVASSKSSPTIDIDISDKLAGWYYIQLTHQKFDARIKILKVGY